MVHALQTFSTAKAILREEGLAIPTGVPRHVLAWKGTGAGG